MAWLQSVYDAICERLRVEEPDGGAAAFIDDLIDQWLPWPDPQEENP